jgi:NADH-quinone oxidoreductase subunit G
MVKDAREGVMEFLLINHPLDCPICDQAGECKLQEQATGYGRGYSRFVEQKNVKPKRTQLGPRVMLDDERCILCSRCIRFSKEIAKDDVLGFIDRGSYSTLTCYPGKKLENNYSLNTVDICPVGALTSTDFRFKMRVWFLKQTNSIDTESSVGANTVVWSREGQIYRITPRRNDEVNDTWLADSARVLYKQVRAENRLTATSASGQPAALDAAITAAAEILSGRSEVGRGVPAEPSSTAAHRDGSPYPGSVAIVGSGRSSVEEQFLTKKLADALKATTALVARVGEGDKLLISADRNPNVRGALVTGLINKLPSTQLTELGAAIDAGKVKTVLSINEDLAAAGLTAAQLAKVKIVFVGTHASPTTEAAAVIIPSATVFEKSGSFINQQFRLQKFNQAIPALAGTHNDLVVLSKLLAAVGGTTLSADLAAIWKTLAEDVRILAGVSFAGLAETGLVLNATDFANLAFPEGETLHFKPAAKPAVATA